MSGNKEGKVRFLITGIMFLCICRAVSCVRLQSAKLGVRRTPLSSV